LAILTDGLTRSASEVFVAALKDLGRARVFGSRTAGSCLPSLVESLPNGDGFQYGIADLVTPSGAGIEGIGVMPDVEIIPTRADLLAGRDPALDKALEWIRGEKPKQARKVVEATSP
jgi:carboxyl-terminal processing protease